MSSPRPSKSGVSTSMVAPVRRRTARTHWRKWSAPPSGKIVASDRRDDHVPQSQPVARFGQAVWLVKGDFLGPAPLDGAKAAGPRADVAQDHERRRAARPALRAVWAASTLANGLQAQLGDQASRERHPPAAGIGRLSHAGNRRTAARSTGGGTVTRYRRSPRRSSPRTGRLGNARVVHPGLGA